MTRHGKILILLAIGLVAGIAVFRSQRDNEPVYNGKKLTEWLPLQDAADWREATNANHAIEVIGTNGIQTLVRLIGYNPERVFGFIDTFPPRVGKSAILTQLYDFNHRRNILAFEAIEAFDTLGQNAIPAIPDLLKIAGSGGIPAARATIALEKIGISGTNALAAIRTNPNYPPRAVIDSQRRSKPHYAKNPRLEAWRERQANAAAR